MACSMPGLATVQDVPQHGQRTAGMLNSTWPDRRLRSKSLKCYADGVTHRSPLRQRVGRSVRELGPNTD
jgi:hypothetical protein